MFTDDTSFYSILGPALISIVVITLIVRFYTRHQPTELHKAILQLKIGTLATGAFLLVLWFLLPCTPVLSSFGYPQTVDEIQSAKQVLKFLQEYNKAIVRTTMVLYWFIFVFIWWFLTTIFSLCKALTKLADDQKDK